MAAVNKLHLLYLLYLRRKKRYRKRTFWVDPILQVRYLEGTYYLLFDKLCARGKMFHKYFRMSHDTFEYILSRLVEIIKKQDTNFRMAIPPREILAVTLRYLATGCTLSEMSFNWRIGISTLSSHIHFVCRKIWDVFQETYLKEMKHHDWEDVANNFKIKASFPMCLGAIDGKHIRIENFPSSGSMHFNYKHYYSIVLLAIVDADYKFLFVDIGAYGKDCDSSILQKTEFWTKLTNNKLNIPDPRPISQGGLKVPYVFVGDNAFAMNEHILKDYSGHSLSVKQRVFNYRLHRARRYVECAFGIMSNKWRIFHRPFNVSKQFSQNIVKACVILHNIVRTRDGYRSQDLFISEGSQIQNLSRNDETQSTNKSGMGVRACFANYFVSENGQLPWQLSKI